MPKALLSFADRRLPFFSRLKHFRRIATRYDKLAANFLAMVQLASLRLWLPAHGSTA
jgi:transposase